MSHPWPLIIFIALLLIGAVLGAWTLRALRVPGWSIAGGLLAGMLLGPTILGRVVTDPYELWMLGAVTQRQARDAVISRHGAERLITATQALDPDASLELRARHEQELDAARAAHAAARYAHEAPLRWTALGLATLVLFSSGLLGVPAARNGGATSDIGEHTAAHDVRPSVGSVLSIGAWAALIPASAAFLCAEALWGYSREQALLVAAAVAIGPWALSRDDRASADAAEIGGARLIQAAGRLASLLALAAVLVGMLTQQSNGRILWTMPLAALPLGWLLRPLPEQPENAGVLTRARVQAAFHTVFIPGVAACAAARVEWFLHLSLWPLLIILLLSDDGRWIGGFLGALINGGRRGLRSMRLVLGIMAAGPTQLCATAILLFLGLIPEPAALALLAGAALIEATAPFRSTLSRRIVEAEREIESTRED